VTLAFSASVLLDALIEALDRSASASAGARL